MTRAPASRPPSRRAHRSFWVLLCVAVLATGSLSSALALPPGPLAGLRVAASGVVLVVAVALAARVLVVAERARRRQNRAELTHATADDVAS